MSIHDITIQKIEAILESDDLDAESKTAEIQLLTNGAAEQHRTRSISMLGQRVTELLSSTVAIGAESGLDPRSWRREIIDLLEGLPARLDDKMTDELEQGHWREYGPAIAPTLAGVHELSEVLDEYDREITFYTLIPEADREGDAYERHEDERLRLADAFAEAVRKALR